MKLSNIKEKMEIKNYKKLCELLEEPVKAGNSKKAQIAEWSRYFSFEKQGNAYIIQEVYKVPKAGTDERQRFVPLIEPILMKYLYTSSQGKEPVEMTARQWYMELGMTTGELWDKDKMNEFLWFYRPDPYSCRIISNNAGTRMKEILVNALNSLQRRGCIKYEKVCRIVDKDGYSRKAHPKEKIWIEKVRGDVLEEMGCKTMYAVAINEKRWKEFSAKTHQIFYKKSGWRNVYSAIEIQADYEIMIRYASIDEAPLKRELHQEVCKSIMEKNRATLRKSDENMDKALDYLGEENAPRFFTVPFDFGVYGELFVQELV